MNVRRCAEVASREPVRHVLQMATNQRSLLCVLRTFHHHALNAAFRRLSEDVRRGAHVKWHHIGAAFLNSLLARRICRLAKRWRDR